MTDERSLVLNPIQDLAGFIQAHPPDPIAPKNRVWWQGTSVIVVELPDGQRERWQLNPNGFTKRP